MTCLLSIIGFLVLCFVINTILMICAKDGYEAPDGFHLGQLK